MLKRGSKSSPSNYYIIFVFKGCNQIGSLGWPRNGLRLLQEGSSKQLHLPGGPGLLLWHEGLALKILTLEKLLTSVKSRQSKYFTRNLKIHGNQRLTLSWMNEQRICESTHFRVFIYINGNILSYTSSFDDVIWRQESPGVLIQSGSFLTTSISPSHIF